MLFLMGMPAVLRRLYAPKFMLKPDQCLGPLPDTATAYKTAFSIAWPSTMETVLVSLVNVVDTIMVSSLGHEAIAAVGLCNQPKFIALMPITVLNMSVISIVARRKGEQDQEGAIGTLKQSLILSAALSLLFTLLGLLFARPLLLFAGAQPDTIGLALDYITLLFLGQIFTAVSLTISSAMRGAGDTKISMKINLTANGVNIVFNWLLIGGNLGFPALGVRGAALATVIGYIAGFLVAIAALLHHNNFVNIVTGGSWRFDKDTLHSMYVVCSGAFLEQLAMRVGFLMYAKTVASLGTVAFATHQICLNLSQISFSFGEGLGIASSSLVGQYLGARRQDISIIYGKVLQRMAFLVSLGLFSVFMFGGEGLMRLFSDEPEIIAVGAKVLVIVGVVVFGNGSQMIFMGSLRGAGDTRYTAVFSLITITIVRPTLAYLLCYPVGWGIYGAWVSFLTDQYLRLFLTYYRFSSGKWAKIAL